MSGIRDVVACGGPGLRNGSGRPKFGRVVGEVRTQATTAAARRRPRQNGRTRRAAIEARDDVFDRQQLAQMNPAQQQHLEVVARLRRFPDLPVRTRQQIESSQQIFTREARRERDETLALALRGNLGIGGAGRIHVDEQEAAREARQLAAHQPQVVPELHGPASECERRHGVLIGHAGDDIEEEVAADDAENGGDVFEGDDRARERDDLIERALRIAHAPVRRPGDERQGLVSDRQLLGVGNLPQLGGNRRNTDRAELEDLRAREDGVRDLVTRRGRHDEHDVRRGFFD